MSVSSSQQPPPIGQEESKASTYSWVSLTRELVPRGASHLKRLTNLKHDGWMDPRLDQSFLVQRRNAHYSDHKSERTWFWKMKEVFQELDGKVPFVPLSGRFDFLDLGCCPGGFSSYVLGKNSAAIGRGISLNSREGGHQLLLEKEYIRRYRVTFGNLILYDLSPSWSPPCSGVHPLPHDIASRSFELVIMDGHQLTTESENSEEGEVTLDYSFVEKHRLLLSQLIIGLQAVSHGGTVILKLNHPEHLRTAQIIYMFDHLSTSVDAVKPQNIHTTRSSFYLIARGVGLGRAGNQNKRMMQGMRKLWQETRVGGEQGKGRLPLESDFDFIVTHKQLSEAYLDDLIRISCDVWCTQKDALKWWFKKKGVEVSVSDDELEV